MIIQNLSLSSPHYGNASLDLYFKKIHGHVDLRSDTRSVRVGPESSCSFDSYFNSFYETKWKKYTEIKSYKWELKLVGAATVRVCRSDTSQSTAVLHEIEATHSSDPQVCSFEVSVPFDTLSSRTYLEVSTKSDACIILKGCVVADLEEKRIVDLAVITPTYKKESYILRTVKEIVNFKNNGGIDCTLYVVDNDSSESLELKLRDFPIHYHQNPNAGCSGGLAKGIIEATRDSSHTHFLFMDDDIIIDAEILHRTVRFLSITTDTRLCLAGAMLDSMDPTLHSECGAFHEQLEMDDYGIQRASKMFQLSPFLSRINLASHKVLNLLQIDHDFDYSGFWYLTVPRAAIEEIECPLPFFLKIDDVDYGLRLNASSYSIASLPGVAVWHDPFYAKIIKWTDYYHYRNQLILFARNGKHSTASVLYHLTLKFLYRLSIFDYASAKMLVLALEHFLHGPDWLRKQNADDLLKSIISMGNRYESETAILIKDYKEEVGPPRSWDKVKTILSGFWLFWPCSKQPAGACKFVSEGRLNRSVLGFTVARTLRFDGSSVERKLSVKRQRELAIQWFSLARKFLFKTRLRDSWRNDTKGWNTREFWKEYLREQQELS